MTRKPAAPSERILASRLALRERFLERMKASPSVADDHPLGSGPPNSHGMPKLPVGQTPTAPGKWPVLDLGTKPFLGRREWRLEVFGECRSPFILDWEGLKALEQVEETSDFHCVTGWSKLDIRWRGVRLSVVIALAEPTEGARFVVLHGYDGYETNLPLEEALKDDVLLAHTVEGELLHHDHGGPVRVVTPQLYAWKGAKWIHGIELLQSDRPGTWERAGYSNTAHPWRNDRYARDED